MDCKVSFICSILGLVMACCSFISYLTLCFPLCKKSKQGNKCPVFFYAKPPNIAWAVPVDDNWTYHAPLHLCIMLILTAVIILFGILVGCEKCRKKLAMGICQICLTASAVALGFTLQFIETDPEKFLKEFGLEYDEGKLEHGYFQMFNAAAGCGLAFAIASLGLAIIVMVAISKEN